MPCRFTIITSDQDFDLYESHFLKHGGSAKLDRNYLRRSKVFLIKNLRGKVVGGFIESNSPERARLYAGDYVENGLRERRIKPEEIVEYTSLWLCREQKNWLIRFCLWSYLGYRMFKRPGTKYGLATAIKHSIGNQYLDFFGSESKFLDVPNLNPSLETCQIYLWKKGYFASIKVLFRVIKYSIRK